MQYFSLDKFKSLRTNLLVARFCQVGTCNTKVGISNLCTHDQNGNHATLVNIPFKLTIVPTAEINFKEEHPPSMEMFMQQFTAIPIGSKLYTLKAHVNPSDDKGITLGVLTNTDHCVISQYGDEKLFFRHQYIEDDIKLRPDWKKAYHKDCFCNYD